MSFLQVPKGRLDLDQIRQENPLPSIVGAAVKLQRAGNEFKACCPFHSEKTPSFTIFANGQRFFCFGCGASGDVLDFVQALHGVGLRDAAEMLGGGDMPSVDIAPLPLVQDDSDRIEEARAVWEAARPIQETVAETYLRHRAIDIALPDALRFTSLRYGRSGPEYPVMVAAISDVADQVVGIQRTYLAADGMGKASVPKTKLSLGRVTGGAVRLTPPSRTLILTEGIEDALSLIQELGRAAWATCGTSNLAKVVLPIATDDVVIGSDADDAGQLAATTAAQIYAEQGCKARIIRPMPGCKDFNQEIQERARA
ncbi:MAG TPA: CHC2 zinc finger domain-containing protein [Novosphingobium sp.]|nr:CHC2 zinc finger domain-containing protein [Novosphingobium sp.]